MLGKADVMQTRSRSYVYRHFTKLQGLENFGESLFESLMVLLTGGFSGGLNFAGERFAFVLMRYLWPD